MIHFACKKFDLNDVIKCGLSLTKSDFKILNFLMKNDDDFSTDELSKKLELEKSTVQRGVKKLHEKGFLFRSQKNQNIGGYLFYYRIKEKEQIKKLLLDIIENWVNQFRSEIKKW